LKLRLDSIWLPPVTVGEADGLLTTISSESNGGIENAIVGDDSALTKYKKNINMKKFIQ